VKILLVDDDLDLVDLMAYALRRAGLDVITAYEAPAALKALETKRPDLAVLDVNLGAANGFDLLKDIRRRSEIPIIMLTVLNHEDDKLRGLDLGAEDYITKPFSHRELIARIRAQLRRHALEWSPPQPTETEIQVGRLTLNVAGHSVANNGERINLTVTEFRLLHYLMLNAGTVVPTRAVLKQVWGYDDPGGTDVVRATVHRVRRKLEDDPNSPQLLHTVPGVGIMLKPEPR
jgi:two-component system response regulator VicR